MVPFFGVRLRLQEAHAQVELRRNGHVLVVRGQLADKGAVVRAHVRDVGVLAAAELVAAVARGEGRAQDGEECCEAAHHDCKTRYPARW